MTDTEQTDLEENTSSEEWLDTQITEISEKEKKSHKKLKTFLKWSVVFFFSLTFSFLIYLVINQLSIFSVRGNSMEPTLRDRQVVVLKQANTVENGQIVFFEKPTYWSDYVSTDNLLVKRIVAIPGDTLTFNGIEFKVNGETVYNVEENNYECSAAPTDFEYTLSSKEIFVMGDNASESLDSRRIFCDGDAEDSFVSRRVIKNYGEIIAKYF